MCVTDFSDLAFMKLLTNERYQTRNYKLNLKCFSYRYIVYFYQPRSGVVYIFAGVCVFLSYDNRQILGL